MSDLNLEKEIYEKMKHFLDDKIDIKKDKFVLVTAHRRENFGSGIENICHAIKTLAQNNQNIKFIYPVHLNPNIQEHVFKTLSKISNIYLIKPLDYLEFSYLMSLSYLVLTDSGGVQEEAPSLGKPVLVLRNTTERPEAVEAGTVRLVGTCIKEIVKTTQLLIDDKNEYGKMSKASNPYGDGKACEKDLRIKILPTSYSETKMLSNIITYINSIKPKKALILLISCFVVLFVSIFGVLVLDVVKKYKDR